MTVVSLIIQESESNIKILTYIVGLKCEIRNIENLVVHGLLIDKVLLLFLPKSGERYQKPPGPYPVSIGPGNRNKN